MTCGNLKCDLAVEPLPDGACTIEPVTDDGTVRIEALDIPELAVRLYRACGAEPPVMLGRPEVDLAKGAYTGPLRAWLEGDGEVTVAVGASQSSIRPHQMRQFAAAAVVLADAAEADDGEFELAAILAAHAGATFPELARAVLADGRFGRLGGGGRD